MSPPQRVLIIDDHACFRAAARDLLERRGFAVVGEADGARTGLAAAERLAPDAVVLDVGLPDSDGFDVCRALISSDPAVAVLLVSADDQRHRVDACGARAFLLKSELAHTDLRALLSAG